MHPQRGEQLAEQFRCAILPSRCRHSDGKDPLLLIGRACTRVVRIVVAVASGSERSAQRRVAGPVAGEEEAPEGSCDLAVKG